MKLLKIGIFAQLDSQTITKQLAPLLRERGHTVDIIDLSTVTREDFILQPEIQALTQYDLVYYRSGLEPRDTSGRILALEAFLKQHPVKTVNLHYTEHPEANSKTYEAQQAGKNGLTIPTSVYSSSTDFTTLQAKLKSPFITKTDYGTQGIGVHLVKNEAEFTKVTSTYPRTKLLHQEFIPHDFEYRVFVIAGSVVSTWKKSPADGDFRSNEAQGGKMLKADPEYLKTLEKLAQTTFTTFGFEIFVADFMLNKNTNEFYFTEINLNPGWVSSVDQITVIDRSSIVCDYFEKLCS